MSIAAPHFAEFFSDVRKHGVVFGIRDEQGHPAPMGRDGKRSMPFWSTKSRAMKIIETVGAYSGMTVVEIPLDRFLANWLPGLLKDGLNVGVNWSGPKAIGYDIAPAEAIRYLTPTDGPDA